MATKSNPRRSTIYAIVALASPVIAVMCTITYQKLAYASFWRTAQNNESHVNGLMAAVEIIQLIFALALGLALGSFFSIVSIRYRKRIFSLGSLAFGINAILLSALAFLWLFQDVHH